MAIEIECRSCVYVPDSYEIDENGKCITCQDTKIEHVDMCDGCSEREAIDGTPIPEPLNLAKYLVHFHDGGSQIVIYCDDCRDLAKMDWNGETKSIESAA